MDENIESICCTDMNSYVTQNLKYWMQNQLLHVILATNVEKNDFWQHTACSYCSNTSEDLNISSVPFTPASPNILLPLKLKPSQEFFIALTRTSWTQKTKLCFQ